MQRNSWLRPALILLPSVAVFIAWGISYWSPSATEIRFKQQKWELALRDGKVVFDNEPQVHHEINLRGEERTRVYALVEELEARYSTSNKMRIVASDDMLDIIRRLNALGYEPMPDRAIPVMAGQRFLAYAPNGVPLFSKSPPLMPVTVRQSFAFPIGALLVLTLIWPARRLHLYLRFRYRYLHMQCVACGYNLRFTPFRCPECGTIPPLPYPAILSHVHEGAARWRARWKFRVD